MVVRLRTPHIKAVGLIVFTAILISSLLSIASPVNAQLPLPPGVKREDVVILDIIHGRTPTPDQFNAWVPGIPIGHFHQLCLDSLWYTNLSSGVSVDVLTAGPPEYRDGFKIMIVKLRDDVYWSDGEKLTSRDLVFTVNACAGNPNLGCHATITTWVESVRALDDYTVEFRLKSPNPYFHYAFTIQTWGAIYMMPAHYFEKIGIENIHADKFYPPICIGPYVLHSHDPAGMWFLFKRRDDYLRSSMGHIVRRFNWPGGPEWVLMRGFINEPAKLMALYAGELDTMFDPSPEAFRAVLATMGDRIKAWQPEWPYFWGHDPTVRGIYFNKAKYPYNLTEVRWALTLAVNITKVMIESWEGIQRLVAVPAAASLFSDLKWSEALLPWLKEFHLSLPDGTKFYPFDPDIPMRIYSWAKAKGYIKTEWPQERIRITWGVGWWKYAPDVAEKLLRGVGFTRGSDGMWRLPDGRPWKIKLNVPTYEIDAIRLGHGVAAAWKEFGIDVEIVTLEATPFWREWQYGLFEVGSYWGGYAWAGDPNAIPMNVASLRCDYVKPVGEYSPNPTRYCNPDLDKLIVEALATLPGTPEAEKLILEIQKHLIANMVDMISGDCKKLLFYVTDHWVGWPSSENPGVNPMFWCSPFKIQLMQLRSAKAPIPSPTPTPRPSPTPTPAPTAVTITTTVVSPTTITVTSTVTQAVTEWTTTVVLAIVLLIVGIGIGWFIKRR